MSDTTQNPDVIQVGQEPELEDDPGEMVCHLAYEEVLGNGASDAAKQQFNDALTKFIDERIAARAGS